MASYRLPFLALVLAGTVSAQRVGAPTEDLTDLGAEELFRIQVTSVGRKAQQLSKAPAAVFVLTSEDIRRSGATSIPEALQWVPGLTVLRVEGRSWVVSARGSARLYAENMLVMIDGASMYLPLFSGVVWDAIDLPLDEIERIEVVRGPGAVMWGPNAVNGVINIITKKAGGTEKLRISAGGGNEVAPQIGVAWSGGSGDRFAYRMSARTERRTPGYGSPGYFLADTLLVDPSVRDLDAGSGSAQFRIDANPTSRDQVQMSANLYTMDRQEPIAFSFSVPFQLQRSQGHSDYKGGFIQSSWTRKSSASSEGVLRFAYSKIQPDYPFVRGDMNTLNVDYQKRWQTSESNEIYVGGGYQQYWDNMADRGLRFSPRESINRSVNVVLRDEWQFIPGRLMGSGGVRLDYDSYRHFEYQPSFRLLFTPTHGHSMWVSASRAIRAANRYDRDVRFEIGSMPVQGLPVALASVGSPDMRSEVERSFEAGYRRQSGLRWLVDSSLFWSRYSRLRAWQSGAPELIFYGAVPFLRMPMAATNAGAGRSYGGEVWGVVQLSPEWKLNPSYSYLNETRWLPPAGLLVYNWDHLYASIPHQGLLRSQHNLSRNLQFDVTARALSRNTSMDLPGGILFGARLGWRPTRSGELSFSVENVLNRHMLQSYPEGPTAAIPLRRMFFLKWTQRL